MEIYIASGSGIDVENHRFELVERKGVGHPDTICDAIAERASQYYSRHCIQRFGRVAHHWFDKVMLIGGEADIDFGRGELIRPYIVIFAGKAAYAFGNQKIPVYEILHQAAVDVLSEVLTDFEPSRSLEISVQVVDYCGPSRKNSRYRPMVLDDLVSLDDKNRISNDCNLLSGYAPLTCLEQMVLFCERYINSAEFKRVNPDTGWDVKVLGSRHDDKFKLLVNLPFIAKYIRSKSQYIHRKEEVTMLIKENIIKKFKKDIDIIINPDGDRTSRPYLTVFGSVADTGDVGVVGRGNRINGLITPMRSMSIEAPAGKNPLDHTGKLYGILAQRLAEEIYSIYNRSAEVNILTSKAASLYDPDEVIVHIEGWTGNEEDKGTLRRIIDSRIRSVDSITEELIFKGITMW
ncbi:MULTISPECIES: methionine adenosyltransferase [unclassified Thermoactinomyces]|uniref:methionine adenosyltransferase n=1 Tax=unclassified Thermoactinomyces TaxID=2634588 RepID=UPI0018DCA15A|nr:MULTISPECIES: methionine adenosyltransferase [unclassified Thermoactinomyces]MBH8605774.1 methionine adenosyltransferase [Thermoactinomyces sp. CICC 10522]MBH8609345.1 methionine adenosyltransferase [Thermoactinomyces sp. CICC 10521]